MSQSKKQTVIIQKIDINPETSEPTIVELSEKQYKSEQLKQLPKQEEPPKKEENDSFSDEHVKQMVMKKVFGSSSANTIGDRQKVFKKIMTWTFIVLVVLILAYTFYNDFFCNDKPIASLKEIRKTVSENWYYLVFAVLSLCFFYLFKGSKLSVLCKVTSKRFHFKTCVETGLLGAYYNNVTPLAVGGQPFEIYHLSKHGVHGGVASSIPIVAFFLNQLAFVILTIISLLLLGKNEFTSFTSTLPVIIVTLSIVGLILCMFVPSMVVLFSLLPKPCSAVVKFVMWCGSKLRIIRNPKKKTFSVMKTVVHNARCVKKISTSPLGFIISIILSFGEQLANASIAYFVLRFFDFDLIEVDGFIEWMMVLQLCFILYSAISFIPTPGNSGAADISFYTLFSAGVAVGGFAFPALMVWRLLSFYSTIIIGFIFVKYKKNAEKPF